MPEREGDRVIPVINSFMNSDKIVTLVCAGNSKEFARYVVPRVADGKIWIFADRPGTILEARATHYAITGSFHKRKDAEKIEALVKSRLLAV